MDYSEIGERLKEAQEEIKRLQKENAIFKEQIDNHRKAEGRLETNHSSLLITAKAELKRKDEQIQELRKEYATNCSLNISFFFLNVIVSLTFQFPLIGKTILFFGARINFYALCQHIALRHNHK